MARLMIVDDSPVSRNALLELLGSEGYECVGAMDGADALAVLQARPIDLVLLDINMPKVSGLAVLEEIRLHHSAVELPVIMVTAHSASQAIVDALARGANDYVTKPLDLGVLLARVRTQLQLRELSSLKDEFLRIASHDLKNPLTSVLGNAHMLELCFPVDAPMTSEGRGFIDAILRSAHRMTRLIRDFLDMQAVQDGRLTLQPAPLELRHITEHVVENNRAYGEGKKITLTLRPGEPTPLVLADEARILQVLENLIGNAIKFGSPGCQVEVVVAASPSDVTVEVRDTGPGLRTEDLQQLFVRGARLGNRPTGGESSTGMGLAWCKQLIELHRGRIGARPGEQGGAVFWFALPQSEQP